MSALPKIIIGKTLFELDYLQNRFVQFADRENIIQFSDLKEKSLFSYAYMNRATNKLVQRNSEENKDVFLFAVKQDLLENGYREGSQDVTLHNKMHKDYNVRFMDAKALAELMEQPFQYKHRQLPETIVGNKIYVVDAAYRELRERDQPFNVINLSWLPIVNGKYEYEDKGFVHGGNDLEGNRKIYIDQLVKLDPEGMAITYGLDKKNLPDNDADIKSDPELYYRRTFKGKLPMMKIGNEDYWVDILGRNISPATNYMERHNLNELPLTNDGKSYLYYDKLKEKITTVPEGITELPKNLVMVILPPDYVVDPVASGKLYTNNPDTFLDKNPIPQTIEARIFPIEQSPLVKQIYYNRQQQNLPQADHRQQTGRKPKKGRGLK